MDAVQLGCDVASTTWQSWHQIPWSDAHQVVARLQTRIAKAAKAEEWRKVRSLQGLLTRSTSAKVLAVRRVAENRGRKTPGLTANAGILLTTSGTRSRAKAELSRRCSRIAHWTACSMSLKHCLQRCDRPARRRSISCATRMIVCHEGTSGRST